MSKKYNRYFEEKSKEEVVETEEVVDNTKVKISVLAKILNVRAEQSTKSKVIATVNKGEILTAELSEDGRWYKLEKGFVLAEFVEEL